jgi:hypothetical protein
MINSLTQPIKCIKVEKTGFISLIIIFASISLLLVGSLGLAKADSSQITLNPDHGPSDSNTNITGSGFTPDVAVPIIMDGKVIGTFTPDAKGNIAGTLHIPAGKNAGDVKDVSTNDGIHDAHAKFKIDSPPTPTPASTSTPFPLSENPLAALGAIIAAAMASACLVYVNHQKRD